MRVFAISDLHVDYEANAKWLAGVSSIEYRDDVLILAGDVTDSLRLLDWSLNRLTTRFRKVLFVPGNHELWVVRDERVGNSLRKFREVVAVAESSGAWMRPFSARGLSIVPLLGWYDYSFGEPGEELKSTWADYRACRWPADLQVQDVASYFAALNSWNNQIGGDTVITFSHFLPRIDLMPDVIPINRRQLYPVLGAARLERQLRQLNSSMHVYGHSHVNRQVSLDGVSYINNAFGYPQETRFAARRLLCIHEC